MLSRVGSVRNPLKSGFGALASDLHSFESELGGEQMREVKVVQDGGSWQVQVVDGDKVQRFTCATEAQANSLSVVMGKVDDPKKRAGAESSR